MTRSVVWSTRSCAARAAVTCAMQLDLLELIPIGSRLMVALL